MFSGRKPKRRIRPPQPSYRQLNNENPEVIQRLQIGVNDIFNRRASELSYEYLYRNCYNLVVNGEGEQLYQAVFSVVREKIERTRERIDGQPDSVYLHFLTDEWDSFSESAKLVEDVFMYLDQIMKEKRYPTTYAEAVAQFYEHVIHGDKRGIVSAKVVALLFEDRMGNTINKMLLRKTVNMLNDIGDQYYAELIEGPILTSTREFFQQLTFQLQQETNVPDYIKKVEERIVQEERRTKMYLSENTVPKIRDVVVEQMVESISSTLLGWGRNGVRQMIANHMDEDLKRVYRLFRKIKPSLLGAFKDVLEEQANNIINGDATKPISYIQDIIDFNDNTQKTIKYSFRNDNDFKDIHHNVKIKYFDGSKTERIPEFLSLFIQEKVCRPDRSSETEANQYLDQALHLLQFIKDKDMFEEYYKYHLALRLLHGKYDQDIEKTLVSNLKTAYGGQFTKKVEQMFNDIHTSSELFSEYKKTSSYKELKASKNGPFDFSVNILSTGSWPSFPDHQMKFPPEMEVIVKSFEGFYHKKFNSRILKWQALLGTGTMYASYPSRRYEIKMPTVGMAILLCFNQSKQFTVQQLQETLNVPVEQIRNYLAAMTSKRTKLLIKESENTTEVYRLNPRFKRNNIRIQLHLKNIQQESEEQRQKTVDRVNIERKYVVDSYIVRVMKARKRLSHNQLLTEVTNMLKIRFTPDFALLKKCISNLIDREYLQRDEKDPSIYIYIS